MKKAKKILGIDVGAKAWGLALVTDNTSECWQYQTINISTFFKAIKKRIQELKPDLVVVGKPNRYINIIASHHEFIGGVRVACEDADVTMIYLNDTTARSTLYPKLIKGKEQKLQVHRLLCPDAKMRIDCPDALDALILAKSIYKRINEESA